MIPNENILVEFSTTRFLNYWNKKYNTAYKLYDTIFVNYRELTTLSKYRWMKIDVICDDCGKIMKKSIIRINTTDDGKHLCNSCIQSGNRGYWHTHKHTPAQCKHMSEIFQGKNNPFFGKTHTKTTREKIRQVNLGNKNHLGKKHSRKTKQQISKTVSKQYQSGKRIKTHGNSQKGYYKNVMYQSSYEKLFLEHLDILKLLDKVDRGPAIKYLSVDNKYHIYLSDYYIADLNLVVEIKSDHFWNLHLDVNLKKQYAAQQKYNYIVIINNDFSQLDSLWLQKITNVKLLNS